MTLVSNWLLIASPHRRCQPNAGITCQLRQSRCPKRFRDVDHLEEVMTTPTPALIADLEKAPGDIVVLGVGGKMGPTLARMAKRADPGGE